MVLMRETVTALLVCGAWACGSGSGSGSGRSPADQGVERGEMVARIGSEEGAGADVFSHISGGVFTSAGNIVVSDEGSADIRFFTPEGRWIRTVGRRGDGPGEYQDPYLVGCMPSTKLTVFDARLGRVTMLSEDGTLVTTIHTTADGRPLGMYDDTAFWVVHDEVLMRDPVYRFHYAIVSSRTGYVRAVTDVSAGAAEVSENGGMVHFKLPPSSAWPVAAACGTRLFLKQATDTVVESVAVDGKGVPVGVTGQVGASVEGRPTLSVGASGALWIGQRIDSDTTSWTVIDGRNETHRVRLPTSFRPLSLVGNEVLGAAKDSLDVEYVEVYRLSLRDRGTRVR